MFVRMYLCWFYDYCCCCCRPLVPTIITATHMLPIWLSACADVYETVSSSPWCALNNIWQYKNFVVNMNDARSFVRPAASRLSTPISIMVWTNNKYFPDASAQRFIGFRRIWTQWWIYLSASQTNYLSFVLTLFCHSVFLHNAHPCV